MSSGARAERGPGWSTADVQWNAQEVKGEQITGEQRRKRRRFTSDACQVEACTVPLELPYHRVRVADRFYPPALSQHR